MPASIQHNSYFDGGVQSLASYRYGRKFSVGIVAKGRTYHVGTKLAEKMSVTSGLLKVKIDGTNDEWMSFPAGTSFEIPANSGFAFKADVDTAYECEYFESPMLSRL